MGEKDYIEMLCAADHYEVVIEWDSGFTIRGNTFLGLAESDMEEWEDDYMGYYYVLLVDVEVLQRGKNFKNDLDMIDNNAIEISLLNIPLEVRKLDGTVLWRKKE